MLFLLDFALCVIIMFLEMNSTTCSNVKVKVKVEVSKPNSRRGSGG